MLGSLFRFWRHHIPVGYSNRNIGLNYLVGDKEGSWPCVKPRLVKGSAAGPGWVKEFLLLGPYELVGPMLLEMSLIEEDAMWGL